MKTSIAEKPQRGKAFYYVWSDSTNFSKHDQDAEVVGKALNKVRSRLGYLDPKEVVSAARPKLSPLHKFFTWDNGAAAEKFRLQEADRLIRSVCVIYERSRETGRKNIKAFVREDTPARRAGLQSGNRAFPARTTYVSVVDEKEERVDADAIRKRLLDTAYRELKSWRSRYKTFKEFEKVFDAIDKLRI